MGFQSHTKVVGNNQDFIVKYNPNGTIFKAKIGN